MDVFSSKLNPEPLLRALHNRISTEKTAGIILSFPSTGILTPEHVAASRAVGIRTILLWGPADFCREAALGREDGRVKTEAQYDKSNQSVFAMYGRTEYDPIRVETFVNCSRLPPAAILERIRPLIATEQIRGQHLRARGSHTALGWIAT
jgi:hypothetical protein